MDERSESVPGKKPSPWGEGWVRESVKPYSSLSGAVLGNRHRVIGFIPHLSNSKKVVGNDKRFNAGAPSGGRFGDTGEVNPSSPPQSPDGFRHAVESFQADATRSG